MEDKLGYFLRQLQNRFGDPNPAGWCYLGPKIERLLRGEDADGLLDEIESDLQGLTKNRPSIVYACELLDWEDEGCTKRRVRITGGPHCGKLAIIQWGGGGDTLGYEYAREQTELEFLEGGPVTMRQGAAPFMSIEPFVLIHDSEP